MATSRRNARSVNGWVVIDKPLGMTSSDVVNRVRWIFQAAKAGHAGTLDPLASGLLPIAMGEATKTVPFLVDGRKSYRFSLRWGQATSTDDTEGEVIAESPRRPRPEEILAALPRFQGWIAQVPPLFSAIKVGGKRAYDLARAQAAFALEPRQVEVHSIRLLEGAEQDFATFEVVCGKGTYMRSLARDLGEALGTAAHIVSLRRLTVGPFREAAAISLESLEAIRHSPAALERVLPVETALDDIPALALTEAEAKRLRCGQAVSLLTLARRETVEKLSNGAIVFAKSGDRPVALTRYEGGDLRPVRVLNL